MHQCKACTFLNNHYCVSLRKTLISIYIIYCSLDGRSKGSAAINMLNFKGVSSVNTSLSAATLFVWKYKIWNMKVWNMKVQNMKVQNTKYESTEYEIWKYEIWKYEIWKYKQSAATLGENLALCYICHSTLTLSSSRISYKLVAVFYVIHIIILYMGKHLWGKTSAFWVENS